MNDITTIFLCYMIELLFIPIFIMGFLGTVNKLFIIKALILWIPFAIVNTAVENAFGAETNVMIINLFSLYFYTYLFAKQSPLHSLFLTILVYIFTMILQAFIILVFAGIKLPSDAPVPILGNVFTLLLAIIVSVTKVPSKAYKFILKQSLPLCMTLINIASICLVLNIYHKLYANDYVQLLLIVILPITAIIMTNYIMIKEYLSKQRDSERLIAYNNYLPVIEEMIDQVRRRQHKFDNEIQTIKGLPTTYSDYDSLCSALGNYSSYIIENINDAKLLKLNFKFLSAFLYQKVQVASKKNISIDLDILTPVLCSAMSEYELIDAVGILFDNMVEATPDGGKCTISINSADGKTIVTTTNPSSPITSKDRALFFKKGYSTKETHEKKRGYGLYELSILINKYGGKIFLENVIIGETNHVRFSIEV